MMAGRSRPPTRRRLATASSRPRTATTQRTRTETPPAPGASGVDWSEDYFDGLGRTYKSLKRGPATTQTIVTEKTYNARSGVATSVLCGPVLDAKALDTGHLGHIVRDENGVECLGMCGDGDVEVFDVTACFQCRFDLPERTTDVVRPFGSRHLDEHGREPSLQAAEPCGSGQPREAYAISATTGCGRRTSVRGLAASRRVTASSPRIRNERVFVSSTYFTGAAAASACAEGRSCATDRRPPSRRLHPRRPLPASPGSGDSRRSPVRWQVPRPA